MKLDRAEIKNFRSIANLNVDFTPQCRVLIGINESGKSNILKALHLLDPAVVVQPSDLRLERQDEAQVAIGWVRFVFQFDEKDLAELSTALAPLFEPNSLTAPLFSGPDGAVTVADWITAPRQGLHIVPLPTGKRSNSSWGLPKETILTTGWFKNKSTTSFDLLNGEKSITVPPSTYVHLDSQVSPPAGFEELTLAQINSLMSEKVGQIVGSQLPECIFWKYSDQYLLPTSIDIPAFCANPNSCVPLKSMFELAGYEINTLLTTITNARQQGHYRFTQILEKTANAATRHVRSVWKDYSTVRIRLVSDGDKLSPMVTDDQVPLDMANRSDGFKRFVSFLLQISAKVETEELQNALILVDEPEMALHPSGCKHLLEELIKIGDSNATVFSTHSIFMIDKENIGRHLVVEKNDEVTTVWKAETSRIQDEEVLYSAMGYSVFETLKSKNVIFEGWRDKYIYIIAKQALSNSDQALKTRLASVGATHANGVKDIKNVAKFLELANRPCLILSDADAPALERMRDYKEPTAWGEWKTLYDVFGPGSFVTAEDLIKTDSVLERANKFRSTIPGLVEATPATLDGGHATLASLVAWLRSAGLNGAPLSEASNALKTALFESLQRNELKDDVDQIVRFIDSYTFH